MNDCSNPPSHFFSSWCTGLSEQEDIHPEFTSPNPLALRVFCNHLTPTRNFTDPTPEYDYEAVCRDDEICVTQWDVPNPWLEGTDEADAAGDTLTDVAWCVSRLNFVKIAESQLTHKTTPDAVAAPYRATEDGSKRQKVSVEATLADPDGHTAVAQKMLIEAQAPGLVNGEQVWHTLIGGVNVCEHCSRLELKSVPPHTHRILVHTILPFAVPEALLYLSRFVT